tara:strand:- start:33335 stop:35380 length:2046 start_codon:yes stop_codon:yes gene_type:complete
LTKITFGKNLLITAIVGLISLLFLLRVFTKNYEKIIETRRINVDQAGEFISEKFKEEVLQNIQALENLKGRIEETNGAYFENWEYDAQVMRQQSESIMFVEWIDSSMTIQRIYPREGNENAVGLNIKNLEYRAPEWDKAARDSNINITQWVELVQGSNAFLVDAPVYFSGSFKGTITAGMNFNRLFDDIISDRNEYFITVSDHRNTTFYESKDSIGIEEYEAYKYTKTFTVLENEDPWVFTLQPNSNIIGRTAFERIGIGLALGLTLSILLTISVFFILESKSAEKRLKVLNEDLNLQKEKAEASSKAKTDFLSTMSHEIRTPMSGIMGLIEILKDEKDEVEIRKYLDMLEISSKNLLALISDILDINKIESGSFKISESGFILKEEIQRILDLNRPVFIDKGLYLELDQSKLKEFEVQSDLGKLNQIFGNLIRNAYKFTEKGGLKITSSGRIVNQQLKVNISFADTGIGISKENQSIIFERFTQIDSGLSRKFEGTGLGLSISKQILELMGGSISVQSEVGEGTIFEVELYLPLSGNAIMEDEIGFSIGSETDEGDDFSSYNALIVDDNKLNQMVLEKVLQKYKVNIDLAENGEVAVQKASENEYDIIFMDLHMPKKDGFEATKEIKEMGIKTPIITVSANVTEEAMAQAKKLGMSEFISKPFTTQIIHSILNTYLKKLS